MNDFATRQPWPDGKRVRRLSLGLGVAVVTMIGAIVLAEGVVRVVGPDMRLVNKLVYYQNADLAAHQPDPDPDLLFRLRPGRHVIGAGAAQRVVTVNSLGARSPERPAAKPPGLFRILCFGASNVYGARVADGETWPAQLESMLNEKARDRYEVWNFGTSAYVALQMAVLAREKIERLAPELVLFAPSNLAERAFLWGDDASAHFARDPQLWREFLDAKCLNRPDWLSFETRLVLVRQVRLYRYWAAYHWIKSGCRWGYLHEFRNIAAARDFFAWATPRVPVGVVFWPGAEPANYQDYFSGPALPQIRLDAAGLADEYRDIHPLAHVYTWYAQELAKQLCALGLVPL